MQTTLVISVVSHGQTALVNSLLADLATLPSLRKNTRLVLTLNTKEAEPRNISLCPFPVLLIRNIRPKGFSSNHNTAFQQAEEKFPSTHFCVMNPDLRLQHDIFASLFQRATRTPRLGVLSPRILEITGEIADHARPLPKPAKIVAKLFHYNPHCPHADNLNVQAEWIAGMFMLFPTAAFAAVKGFDERFFLYYEDVDICCRLRLAGYEIVVDSSTTATHQARRASHRNLRYFRHHVFSMIRFFASKTYRDCSKATNHRS